MRVQVGLRFGFQGERPYFMFEGSRKRGDDWRGEFEVLVLQDLKAPSGLQ